MTTKSIHIAIYSLLFLFVSPNGKCEENIQKETKDSYGYMVSHFKNDVIDLHLCARKFGISLNFDPDENDARSIMIGCAPIREVYIQDCINKFSQNACSSSAGMIIMLGAGVADPIASPSYPESN